MFLTRLSIGIQMNSNVEQVMPILSNENSSNEEELVIDIDQVKMRQFIVKILRDKEVLIVFDNCEDPLEDDDELFVKQLDILLEN
jgi:hypothetical protein